MNKGSTWVLSRGKYVEMYRGTRELVGRLQFICTPRNFARLIIKPPVFAKNLSCLQATFSPQKLNFCGAHR